jgi:hypothetical protein
MKLNSEPFFEADDFHASGGDSLRDVPLDHTAQACIDSLSICRNLEGNRIKV